MEYYRVRTGTSIFKKSEFPDKFFLIEDGEFSDRLGEGVGEMKTRGDFLGEISCLLGEDCYFFDVKCEKEGHLWALPSPLLTIVYKLCSNSR